MIKFRPKLYSAILSIGIISISAFSVLHTEQEKRHYKAVAEEKYYSDIYAYWENYKSDYLKQVGDLKKQNSMEMEETKSNYYALLQKQPALIQEHTRIVKETSYVPQQGSSSGAGNSGSTTSTVKKQVISVPKPSSKPTTGAS